MSTDVVKEPMYTWTFSHRSLLIRLYLWVYTPENPSSTTFCKLFWGTILTPITLPLMVFLKVVGGVAKCVAWPFGRLRAHLKSKAKEDRARNLEWWSDWKERVKPDFYDVNGDIVYVNFPGGWHRTAGRFHLYQRIPYEAPFLKESLKQKITPEKKEEKKKTGPSAPERVVTWVSGVADKAAAYVQEHPEIKQKADVAVAYTGKFFVRGIFYPLMILVPIAVFAFAGWQVEQHWHGPVHGFMWFGDEIGHYLWRVLEMVGLWILLCVGAFAGMAILVVGSCWMSVQYDKMFPPKYEYDGPSARAAIPSSRESWRRNDDGGIVYQGSHIIAERWGAPLATTGNVIIWPFKMVVLALAAILLMFWKVTCACGRGAQNTTRFMIAGHHTVKYRTCPKILITEDEAA